MALLADDDDPELEVHRSDTDLPLFTTDSEQYSKLKDKRDKKLRSEDKRGSVRNLPWTKTKDSNVDKTPKKSKHSRNKSSSRTPPDSPKASNRSEDFRRGSRSGGSTNQPSPTVKSNRKSYCQLGDLSDNDSDEGYTVSNQPVVEQDQSSFSNPWSTQEQHSPPISIGLDLTASASEPWPQLSPTHQATVQFPVLFEESTGNKSLSQVKALGEPSHESHLFTTSLPPPQPLAPAPSYNPSSTGEPDWSISDELRDKCVSQFQELSSSGGLLQGDKAREFFVLSKLPNAELSTIWRLADVDRDNALSEHEFCVAMKLVLMRRKGHEIPTTLPQVLLSALITRTFSNNFDTIGQSSHTTEVRDTIKGPLSGFQVESNNDANILVNLGEGEEALLVHKRTGSEGSIPNQPVPTVKRSKTFKETSEGTSQRQGLVTTIDQGTSQVSRKTNKRYSVLQSEEEFADGFQLNSQQDVEMRSKGHNRGKSLDLNKMIHGSMSRDNLEDLPSAEPPKPPPRPHQSPPLEQSRTPVQSKTLDEPGEPRGVRVRSLSTGSITNHPDERENDSNALLKDKPKTRKLRAAPRRPPPPVKKPERVGDGLTSKAELSAYQVPGKTEPLKSKRELQSSIRSLKDQNAMLSEINKALEAQLFKLIEERVGLEHQLETANMA